MHLVPTSDLCIAFLNLGFVNIFTSFYINTFVGMRCVCYLLPFGFVFVYLTRDLTVVSCGSKNAIIMYFKFRLNLKNMIYF